MPEKLEPRVAEARKKFMAAVNERKGGLSWPVKDNLRTIEIHNGPLDLGKYARPVVLDAFKPEHLDAVRRVLEANKQKQIMTYPVESGIVRIRVPDEVYEALKPLVAKSRG